MQKRPYIKTDEQKSYLIETLLAMMNVHDLDTKQILELVRMLIPSQEPERFFSINETAKILNMSVKTLYNARMKGDIHWREYNGKIRFCKEDIEEFQLKCRR